VGQAKKMRNNPMEENYRIKCLARTRKETLCEKLPIKGKKRCRMHGGAENSGAPKGNKNAFKHGHYSEESLQRKREVTQFFRGYKKLMKEINE